MSLTEKLRENRKKGHPLKCPNSECGYVWMYSGRFSLYATCPSCRRNVKICENKIVPSQAEQVESPVQTVTTASAISTNKDENRRHE